MALASLNLAASNLSALAAKLAPTSLSALIPAKLAAIPVVAGLAVGTAAGASFVASPAYGPAAKAAVSTTAVRPSAMTAPAAPTPAPRVCETQTWPYLDTKCMAGGAQEKRIRLVTAPRASEVANAAPSAPDGLTTSDTVLRAPQNIDAIPPAETKPAPREKRRDTRKRDRRFTAQSYDVPSESRRHARPVIVVRPLRLDMFR